MCVCELTGILVCFKGLNIPLEARFVTPASYNRVLTTLEQVGWLTEGPAAENYRGRYEKILQLLKNPYISFNSLPSTRTRYLHGTACQISLCSSVYCPIQIHNTGQDRYSRQTSTFKTSWQI